METTAFIEKNKCLSTLNYQRKQKESVKPQFLINFMLNRQNKT